MTGQPDQQDGAGRSDHASQERLSEEGAGLGMSDDGSTFEPEETPEAVDDPEDGPGRGDDVLDDVVDPRELVPEEDRADDLQPPRAVVPDAERDVREEEPEAQRLLPDADRPVPAGPDDDDTVEG